jgi:hypothetical protein
MHEIGAILLFMGIWLFGILVGVGVGFIFYFLSFPGFVIAIIIWTAVGFFFLWWLKEAIYIAAEAISYWRS